jgi:hypothetical protein
VLDTILVLMKTRSLFLCGALLLFAFVNGANAADEGTYKRTKDGKTLVWDSHPLPNEEVEWSGQRDKDGYATGQGTVTWYEPENSGYTFVKKSRLIVAGRYTGKMVKGKLDGIVIRQESVPTIRWKANPERVFYATFVNGKIRGVWFEGRPPSDGPAATAPSSSPHQPAKEKTSAPAKEG